MILIIFIPTMILTAIAYRIYKDKIVDKVKKEMNDEWVNNLIENIP